MRGGAGGPVRLGLQLAARLAELLVALLLLSLALVPLHILVLDSVDGGDAHLHLRQDADSVRLGHPPVFLLEVVEGVARQSKQVRRHPSHLQSEGRRGIRGVVGYVFGV